MTARRLVMLAALLGAAAAGALAGRRPAVAATDGARPAPAVDPALVPPYGGAPFFALGGPVHVGGRPRRLQYALTADLPVVVAGFYERVWRTHGLAITRRRVEGEEWVVARDAQGVRTVVVLPHPRGALLIASARGLDDAVVSDPVPRPEGCAPTGRGGADDPGARRELAAFECPGRPDAALAFYRRVLGEGRTVASDEPHGSITRFTAPGVEVVVTARSLSGEPPRALLVVDWQETR